MVLKLVAWNIDWAPQTGGNVEIARNNEIMRRINGHSPEVICLTEALIGRLPKYGKENDSQAYYGYTIKKGQEDRRKVLLWSRKPTDAEV